MIRYYPFRKVETSEVTEKIGRPYTIDKATRMTRPRHNCIEMILTDESGQRSFYGIFESNFQAEFLKDMKVPTPEGLVGKRVLGYIGEKGIIEWISNL